MDKADTILVNSPFKKLMQKYFEFPIFKTFLKSEKLDIKYKVVLEAGCGAGYGLQIIHDEFVPKELHGFDILEEEIKIAKKKKIPAEIFVGDVLDTKFPDKKFDVVFVLEVLHHVPQWREGLKELNRIMKRGGILLISEHCKDSVKRLERVFGVKHPKEANFRWNEFYAGILSAGFIIKHRKIIFPGLGFYLCIKTKEI